MSSIYEKIGGKCRLFFKKNSSTVLTTMGVIGFVGTIVLAIKETPKAIDILKKEEKEKGEKLSKIEIIKKTASTYTPMAVLGISSIACLFGANVLNRKQQACLASAYAFLNTSYKQYKDKIKEVFGEDGRNSIEERLMEDDKKSYNYIKNNIGIDISNIDEINDEILFYDKCSERYFKSTIKKIREAEYDLNKIYYILGYSELNDFYKLIGLPTIERGSYIGWSSAWCPGIEFELIKANTDDGLECYIIEPTFMPDDYYINW